MERSSEPYLSLGFDWEQGSAANVMVIVAMETNVKRGVYRLQLEEMAVP